MEVLIRAEVIEEAPLVPVAVGLMLVEFAYGSPYPQPVPMAVAME